MLKLFKKDPIKKMNAEYQKLLEQAMNAQRNGDIEGYAKLTEDANRLLKDIEALEKEKAPQPPAQ